MYHGDIALGQTIDLKFTTRRFTTGVPFTLAGSPVVSAYVGNGTTQLTAGITLSVDFDSVTGLNNVRVVASSGNGYATATDVELVITTGTVDSVSVVGEVIGSFSIENRAALRPTTAGRTLDVSTDGDAEANVTKWAGTAVATPSVAGVPEVDMTHLVGVAQSATDLKDFADDGYDPSTNKVQGVVLVDTVTTTTTTTNLTNLPSIPANWITAAGINDGAITNAKFAAGAIDAAALATDAVAEIADGVWDEAIAGHLGAGSTGLALNSASSGGDPWGTALPGAYGAGTAGHILGTGIPDIAPGSANGLLRGGTNAATSITTALTANLIGDVTGNLSGSVGSVTGAVGSVTGAVGSVVGNVGGNVTGSVGSVATGGITAASFAAGAIDAAALAADATTEIATAVWASATRTLTSFGTLAADVWAAVTRTLTAGTNIVLAKGVGVTGFTDLSQADVRTAVGLAAANLDTQLAAIQTDVNTIEALVVTNLDGTISSRATPAQVNAEVVDALAVDTYAEPTGVPPATTTLALKIGRLHQALRNRVTVTAADGMIFYTDANVALWRKILSDDGTVYDEGEAVVP